MSYNNLPQLPTYPNRFYNGTDLKSKVLHFISDTCVDLRCNPEKTDEKNTGNYTGTSIKQNMIPYNQEKDTDRLCLENALRHFLESGAKNYAFDVYCCYLEMFMGGYGKTRNMIEMLSEYEMNGSSLLMKHRDHYVHSVYVFALGLAVYESNTAYREAYRNFYNIDNDTSAAHHFLEYWGLASLFHDIGYPFELPFEQVESYFEVKKESRANNPFVAYVNIDKFISINNKINELLKDKKFYGKTFVNTNELFAYNLAAKLKDTYYVTTDSIRTILETKSSRPDVFGYYMDHAYFSAAVLFQKLYGKTAYLDLNNIDPEQFKCRIDAMTAILLHNSLYKFSIGFYKDEEVTKPFQMKYHPLAYLLMLCDELQCWDRTPYGRNSRSELHPFDCKFIFSTNSIDAVYIYDESEIPKIDRFKAEYENWEKNAKTGKCPKLNAYSTMVGENSFLGDIKKLLDTSNICLSISVDTEKYNPGKKQVFLSNSNFLHLYDFAVILNGRYNIMCDKRYSGNTNDLNSLFDLATKEDMENSFEKLSLEYKLSNISQAKSFAKYLDKLGMLYTDRSVSFKMVDGFTDEQLEIIGIMEHHRWLKEHQEMGWIYGNPGDKTEREISRTHTDMIKISPDDQEITEEMARQHYFEILKGDDRAKDKEPMKCMLMLIKQYDGLRIYYLPDRDE